MFVDMDWFLFGVDIMFDVCDWVCMGVKLCEGKFVNLFVFLILL